MTEQTLRERLARWWPFVRSKTYWALHERYAELHESHTELIDKYEHLKTALWFHTGEGLESLGDTP